LPPRREERIKMNGITYIEVATMTAMTTGVTLTCGFATSKRGRTIQRFLLILKIIATTMTPRVKMGTTLARSLIQQSYKVDLAYCTVWTASKRHIVLPNAFYSGK
jgi:hypothetical protein